MEGLSEDEFPCSSIAVDSFLRLGFCYDFSYKSGDLLISHVIRTDAMAQESSLSTHQAGSAWGLFIGPYEAGKKGFTGTARASFVVKSVGKYGTYCGLFAGMFAATRCGIRRYRRENDWVNASIAGAVTGAALAMRTRSYQQIFTTAAIVSAIATAADYSTAI